MLVRACVLADARARVRVHVRCECGLGAVSGTVLAALLPSGCASILDVSVVLSFVLFFTLLLDSFLAGARWKGVPEVRVAQGPGCYS